MLPNVAARAESGYADLLLVGGTLVFETQKLRWRSL